MLGGSHQNRKAERPVNALLNNLFSLLKAETTLACLRVGIDPSLGVLHADETRRESMALDLMEPRRQAVEAWTLELRKKRSFTRSDYHNARDGHVRLLASLTHELAASMGQWWRLVSPWVEEAHHQLGEVIKGRFTSSTPLTQAKSRRAQRAVRARKAVEALSQSFAGLESHSRQRSRAASVALDTCVQCGGPTLRGQHQRCLQYWEELLDQEISVSKRRGEAISKAKKEISEWRSEHPSGDPQWYKMEVWPRLEGVPLRAIMEATGVAKSTASLIRVGRLVPAERHWPVLSALSESSEKLRG